MYNVKVFSSFRKIRHFIDNAPNGALPKLYTISDFIDNLIIVPGKIAIDDTLRVIFLHNAIKKLDKKKLAKLGIPEGFQSFISFLSKKDFFFRFFEELSVEKSDLEQIKKFDVYAEFEEHILILEEVLKNYTSLLDKNNFYDKITLKEYVFNEAFLNSIKEVEIYIDGYLTEFEKEIFKKLKNVKISFLSTPFNKKLAQNFIDFQEYKPDYRYLVDLKNKKVVQEKSLSNLSLSNLNIFKTSLRITQVAVILKEIESMINKGISPENIAVILPDEEFMKYLMHFDKNSVNDKRIFNFAMGFPFKDTEDFKKLEKFYIDNKTREIENFSQLIEFLKNFPIDNEEAKSNFDEAVFKFEKLYSNIELKIDELFYIFLKSVEDIKISDNSGGKITVMGVLESRGMNYDGVIIPDFNEGVVPKVSDKDIFLNTFIRKNSGLPTREDRENLQKHYFYTLLKNSKYSSIIFVENNEKKPSRFLNELNLNVGIANAETFIEAILPKHSIKPHYFEKNKIEDKNFLFYKKILTPTMLKTYLECKRKFYFQYYKNLSYEEEDKFNLGIEIHEAIRNFANKDVDEDNYFQAIWNHLQSKVKTGYDKLMLELWKSRIINFVKKDIENLSKVKKIISEKEFKCKLSNFILKARIDRIEIYNDKVKLIDFKTTREENLPVRNGKFKKNITDYQLVFYYLIGKEIFKDMKIEVGYFLITEPKLIVINDLKEKIEELENILENIPDREIFDSNETYCYFCDYKLLCGSK